MNKRRKIGSSAQAAQATMQLIPDVLQLIFQFVPPRNTTSSVPGPTAATTTMITTGLLQLRLICQEWNALILHNPSHIPHIECLKIVILARGNAFRCQECKFSTGQKPVEECTACLDLAKKNGDVVSAMIFPPKWKQLHDALETKRKLERFTQEMKEAATGGKDLDLRDQEWDAATGTYLKTPYSGHLSSFISSLRAVRVFGTYGIRTSYSPPVPMYHLAFSVEGDFPHPIFTVETEPGEYGDVNMCWAEEPNMRAGLHGRWPCLAGEYDRKRAELVEGFRLICERFDEQQGSSSTNKNEKKLTATDFVDEVKQFFQIFIQDSDGASAFFDESQASF